MLKKTSSAPQLFSPSGSLIPSASLSADSSRLLTLNHAWGARSAHAAACNPLLSSQSQSPTDPDPEPPRPLVAAYCCSTSPNTDCTTETDTPRAPRSGCTLDPGTATEGSTMASEPLPPQIQEVVCGKYSTSGPPRLADSSVHSSPAALRSPQYGML